MKKTIEAEKSAPARVRILLVDDHAIVRHGLAVLLKSEKDLEICGEAGTYEEALLMLEKCWPDLMILDITLKDKNGLDLLAEIRAQGSTVKVIILSMHEEGTFAERALRLGAQGYIMKENADEVLIPALRTVLGGQMYVSPRVSTLMLRHYLGEGGEAGGATSLTEREREIFECIGRGMSTRAIAEKFSLSGRTVEVHRTHIKKKMNCDTAAQLVREAVKYVEQQNVLPSALAMADSKLPPLPPPFLAQGHLPASGAETAPAAKPGATPMIIIGGPASPEKGTEARKPGKSRQG